MGTHVRIEAVLAAGLLAGVVAAARAQLTYVDRSSGLTNPRMEGGNTELELGDVNGDGHVDIVCIGDHGSPYVNTQEHGVMVWFGDGAGNWSVFQYGDFGYGGCALGDVNGDGLMDIGYGMHHDYSSNDLGDQLLEVALGDGSGRNWQPWDDGLATNGETWGMFGTDFADIDNDGDLDVGSTSFGCCAGVHVYRNNGDGTWTQTFGFTGGNSAMVFVFGDVNGDGHADFAASQQNGTVYLGDGRGGFTRDDGNLPSGGSLGRRGASLGDVDGDGRDDLAFANANRGLNVFTWDGPGTWRDLSGGLPASGTFEYTQIADMDLDGLADLVAFSEAEIVVYGGDGAGNWRELARIAPTRACDTAALRAGVDGDHNGYPDIAVVVEQDCGPFTGGINTPHFYAESTPVSTTWVWPKYPRGGETFVAGSVRFIDWHAAVAGGETAMSIELSLNGPGGPWTPIAVDVPNNGRFQWRVPSATRNTREARLRFRLGGATAVTPGSFAIVGGSEFERGDMNCDGVVSAPDIEGFVLALFDPAGYAQRYPDCDVNLADMNGDGRIDSADIEGFIGVLFGP